MVIVMVFIHEAGEKGRMVEGGGLGLQECAPDELARSFVTSRLGCG